MSGSSWYHTLIPDKTHASRYLTGSTLRIILIHGGAFLLSFGLSLWLAHLLGSHGYGMFTYAFSWVTVSAMLAGLGLHKLLVRETTSLQNQQAWGVLKGLLRWSVAVVFVLSTLLAGFLYLLLRFTRIVADPMMEAGIMLALPAIPLLTLTFLGCGTLQGLKYSVLSQVPEKLIRSLALLALLGLWLLLEHQPPEAGAAILLNIAAFGMMCVVALTMAYRKLPADLQHTRAAYQSRIWGYASLSFLFISSMNILDTQTDLLMLGFFTEADQVGIYQIAKRVGGWVILLHFMLNISLAPLIADMYSQGKREALQRLVTSYTRLVFLLSLPVAALLILGGQWVLLLFGSDFTAGKPALVIICAGELFNVAIGPATYLLAMTGKARIAAIAMGVGVLVNIILNLLLIPLWGMEGAATATTAGTVSWCILMVWWARRHTGMDATVIGK